MSCQPTAERRERIDIYRNLAFDDSRSGLNSTTQVRQTIGEILEERSLLGVIHVMGPQYDLIRRALAD